MNTKNKLLLAAIAACSCTLAQAASETRDISGFTAIDVSGGIDLELTQGDSFSVEVDSEHDDLDDISTELRGETLRISWEDFPDFRFGGSADTLIRITLPTLTEIEASGGSDVESTGTFSGDDLELNTSGGSGIELDLAVATLDVRASGGSELRLSGTATRLDMRSSGGSDIDARDLVAEEADLTCTGGSDITITVTERLIASASGGSDIRYGGDPADRDIDASNDSDVTRR